MPRSEIPGTLRRLLPVLFLGGATLFGSTAAGAFEDVHLAPEAFIAGIFPGQSVRAGKLACSEELGWRIADALGHATREKRFRYWQAGTRTAWILDETGKERPITIGVAVDNGRVVAIRVLIYRETHGHEVADPAYTKRYEGAALAADDRLDRDIDNITGATLSARAMTRVARAALVLDDWVHRHEDIPAP